MSTIQEAPFSEPEKITIANAIGELMAETAYLNMLGIPVSLDLTGGQIVSAWMGRCLGLTEVGRIYLDGNRGIKCAEAVIRDIESLDRCIKVAAAEWLEAQGAAA